MVEQAPRPRKSKQQQQQQSSGGSSISSNSELQITERVNARVAMAGVALTILLELFSGKPLTHWLTGA
jgi:hypothetical protein